MRKVMIALLFAAALTWIVGGCLVPSDSAQSETPEPAAGETDALDALASAGEEPEVRIPIPGTDQDILISPEILERYARGAEAAGDALPPPVGPIAKYGGWGLAALAETWRRYDRRKRQAKETDKDNALHQIQSAALSLTEGIEVTLAKLDVTDPKLAAKIREEIQRVQDRRGVQEIVNALRAGESAEVAAQEAGVSVPEVAG